MSQVVEPRTFTARPIVGVRMGLLVFVFVGRPAVNRLPATRVARSLLPRGEVMSRSSIAVSRASGRSTAPSCRVTWPRA